MDEEIPHVDELCSVGYQFLDPNPAARWRSPISLVLGELIEYGVVNFSEAKWDFDAFDEEQRNRLWRKFEARYRYRSIGVLPLARWRRRVVGQLNELMSKYRWAYQALAEGIDPMQSEGRFRKYRNIDSDFPQTLLSRNQDYASYGTDFEEEEDKTGDWLEFLAKLKRAKGVDEMILDEMEGLFSSLITVSVNGH